MTLHIKKDNIFFIKADAIVIPIDTNLSFNYGLSKAIYDKCKDLLDESLSNVNHLNTSDVVVCDSCGLANFNKLIFVAIDNNNGLNKESIIKCYRSSLSVVLKEKLNSIAIPLLTSYQDFNKQLDYEIATSELNEFLIDNDIDITLVLDKTKDIQSTIENVRSYINDYYRLKEVKREERKRNIKEKINDIVFDDDIEELDNDDTSIFNSFSASISEKTEEFKGLVEKIVSSKAMHIASSDMAMPKFVLDESFSEAILRIIDEKGLTDPYVYHKAGLDRKLFSKLRSNVNYQPLKKTAISLCLALELNVKQTNDLLKKAGYTLSKSNTFDVIINYCIKNRIYDLYTINLVLFDNDQEILG